ncbi:MAG TPA: isochorismatase family protein [Anaeromyxobacteraceae bacterium]|nr:isochorismatase family protein [Anaeromyxobacteraceae bacterium]
MIARPKLHRSTACLLVVDVQEKLVPLLLDFGAVERRCRATILGARELGLPVLATEQYPKGLGPTVASLREVLPTPPLEKRHFSCSSEADFAKALLGTNRKQVIVIGVEAHICVFQTVRDLVWSGHDVFVCADAVTSRLEEHRRIALEQMRDLGAVVTSTETVLFDLLEVCGTPEFKRISALVK